MAVCPECGHEGGWRCERTPPFNDVFTREKVASIRWLSRFSLIAGAAPIGFGIIAICIHLLTLVLGHYGFARPGELWLWFQNVISSGPLDEVARLTVLIVYLASGRQLFRHLRPVLCSGLGRAIIWPVIFAITGALLWLWVAAREVGLHSRIPAQLSPYVTAGLGILLSIHFVSSSRPITHVVLHGPKIIAKYTRLASGLALCAIFIAFVPFHSDLNAAWSGAGTLTAGGYPAQGGAIDFVLAFSALCLWLNGYIVEAGIRWLTHPA